MLRFNLPHGERGGRGAPERRQDSVQLSVQTQKRVHDLSGVSQMGHRDNRRGQVPLQHPLLLGEELLSAGEFSDVRVELTGLLL